MAEEKTNYFLTSIVSIVAIVALVVLFVGTGTTHPTAITTPSTDLNVAGEAYKGNTERASERSDYVNYGSEEINNYIERNNIDLNEFIVVRESTRGRLVPGEIRLIPYDGEFDTLNEFKNYVQRESQDGWCTLFKGLTGLDGPTTCHVGLDGTIDWCEVSYEPVPYS